MKNQTLVARPSPIFNNNSNNYYYVILGVEPAASFDNIRSPYKRLTRRYHPDKGGDPDYFVKIQEAYATLSDPLKRAAYDRNETTNVSGTTLSLLATESDVASNELDEDDIAVIDQFRALIGISFSHFDIALNQFFLFETMRHFSEEVLSAQLFEAMNASPLLVNAPSVSHDSPIVPMTSCSPFHFGIQSVCLPRLMSMSRLISNV
ncbi:MAG: DnaJ domain-containing protein [Coxiellaceae bacterium]|nr:DnaJ domain-containing protein [Coxiellaceae bacterium]